MSARIARSIVSFAAMIAVFLLQTHRAAQSEDIIFNASPTTSGEACIIELLQEGTFGVNANERILDSRRFGGIGAEIRVTSRKRPAGSSPGARFRITLERVRIT